MNLPDTYACGIFNLPLRIAKLARLADSTTGNEREVARRKLLNAGYFLDRAGILWPKTKVPVFARDKTLDANREGE